MNIALPLGLFFTLWKTVHGAGSSIPYPGPTVAYERTNTETPMGANARFQIFASLQGEKTHAQAYNIGAPTSTYAEKWPLMAAEFGLVGVGPVSEGGMDIADWVGKHKYVWNGIERQHGLKASILESAGWGFLVMLFIPFNRDYDISKSREIGFKEQMDVISAYKEAWGMMVQAKLLPPLS
jgi:hypothetical protein